MEQDHQVRGQELVEESEGKPDQEVVVWVVRLLPDRAVIVFVPVAAKQLRTSQDNLAIKCNVQNAVRL